MYLFIAFAPQQVTISNLEEIQNQMLACKFKAKSKIDQGQQTQVDQ